MDSRVAALVDILRLNTKLFRNCLDNLSDDVALVRPSSTTNSAAFIAAHLADSRFFLLRVVGVELSNPLAPYLDGSRGIEDIDRYPSLEEVQSAWTLAAHALRDRLAALTAAELDGPTAVRFFRTEQTMLGALTFLVQHDSYHIGQLALLRKYAGLPAMRYT